MEVTSKNFATCLPEIFSAIDSADFISIDGEFTGLHNGPEATAYDTPAEYYTKLRSGSLDFLLVQVGICTYKFDLDKNKYVYKVFNFYVFPGSINKMHNDVKFVCQASSIKFLSNAGFDFNKLFKEGIPYLSLADEKLLQTELTEKYENISETESYPKVPIPEELATTVDDICKRIGDFLSPENEEKELHIDECNGFVRKLVFQTAYEKFSTKNFSLTTKWIDNAVFLVAQKGKSKVEQDKENLEKDRNELKDAIGFSKVIHYISDKKKLIVGHNMLLDICHIIKRFFLPLPSSYIEFKEIVRQLFPKIIDTKYMCSAPPFENVIPSSVLDHMMKRLRSHPFKLANIEPESSEFGYPEIDTKAHEAGYDAFITGLAFITLTTYLGKKAKKNLVKCDFELLKRYENRLYLMKIMDYTYVNLKGSETIPNRDHVYHITFPSNWKTKDIIRLFKDYADVYVSYIDSTTAWITLASPEKADCVNTALKSTISSFGYFWPNVLVIPWSVFEKNKRNNAKISPPTKVAIPSAQKTTEQITAHDGSSNVEEKRSSDIDDVPHQKKNNAKISPSTNVAMPSIHKTAQQTVAHEGSSNVEKERSNDIDDVPRKKNTNAKISSPTNVSMPSTQKTTQQVVAHEGSSNVEKKRSSNIDDVPRKKKKKGNFVMDQSSRISKKQKKVSNDQDSSKLEHTREKSPLLSVCKSNNILDYIGDNTESSIPQIFEVPPWD